MAFVEEFTVDEPLDNEEDEENMIVDEPLESDLEQGVENVQDHCHKVHQQSHFPHLVQDHCQEVHQQSKLY